MPWVELFADFVVFANKRRFYPFSCKIQNLRFRLVRKLGIKIKLMSIFALIEASLQEKTAYIICSAYFRQCSRYLDNHIRMNAYKRFQSYPLITLLIYLVQEKWCTSFQVQNFIGSFLERQRGAFCFACFPT